MRKIMKQILAALLAVGLLQMNIVAFAADTQDNADYDIMLLKKLGFVNEAYGPKSGDEPVTRSQFASMVAYLRGFDETNESTGRNFIDIPADYWCAGQIYALYNDGLVHGTASDIFSPEEYVTYPQAVKCLVSLLGYDVQAKKAGGYPDGYISTASQIGLGSGVTDGAIDFRTAARLIVKAMDTEVLELVLSGGDGEKYAKSQYQTPLKKYNDIYYDTGVMTDNGISTLTGNTNAGSRYVVINDTVIGKGECDVEKYLGYRLKYYYKNNDGELTLLFVMPYNTKVIEIKDEDLDTSNPQFGMQKICYVSDKGEKSCKIDDYADVIYNGKAYPAFDADTFKITQGRLTLIDNDNDGDYDVIYVEEYYCIYVSSIDIDNEIIYGKYGNSVEYGKYTEVQFYTADGSAATVDAVSQKQVLSVLESRDDSMVSIIISTEFVSGKIESLTDTLTKPQNMLPEEIGRFRTRALDLRIVVNGEELAFSSEYIDAVIAGYQGASIPTMGLTYIFRLDSNRKIAGIEDPTGVQYAYLIKVAHYTHGEMGGMTMARVFMQDSSIITTVFAKNVTVDGQRYKGQSEDNDAVQYYPKFLDEDGRFVRQPVKIRLNNLGEITEIETANNLTNSYGYDKTKFTMCYKGNQSYGGSSQRRFDKYTLANDVVIFNIPPDSDFDESELSVISASTLQEGANYPVQMYDADASWACKFVVIQAGESSDWYLASCVIESVKYALIDEDTVAKVATGLESTNRVTYVESKPGVFPEELASGDIVRVVKGVNNKIVRMQILASATRDTQPFYNRLDGDEWSTYYGQLYARSDTGFTLTMDGGASIEGIPFNDTSICVYDMKTKTARRGTRNDMVMNCPISDSGRIDLSNCNSMIYVFKRRGYARNVIVVKY